MRRPPSGAQASRAHFQGPQQNLESTSWLGLSSWGNSPQNALTVRRWHGDQHPQDNPGNSGRVTPAVRMGYKFPLRWGCSGKIPEETQGSFLMLSPALITRWDPGTERTLGNQAETLCCLGHGSTHPTGGNCTRWPSLSWDEIHLLKVQPLVLSLALESRSTIFFHRTASTHSKRLMGPRHFSTFLYKQGSESCLC